MKNLSSILVVLTVVFGANTAMFSQNLKKNPPTATGKTAPEKLKINPRPVPQIPLAEDPFGVGEVQYKSIEGFNFSPETPASVKVFRGENGLPILFTGRTTTAEKTYNPSVSIAERALDYVASLQPEALKNPANEFQVLRSETDEQGKEHVRLQQKFKNIPVFGGEMIAHAKQGVFEMLNGRYFPTPSLENLEPKIQSQQAYQIAIATLPANTVKQGWSAKELEMVGGKNFTAELVIYHPKEELRNEKLAWHLDIHPNLMRRFVFFVDAQTGEILNQYDFTCQIDGGRVQEHFCHAPHAAPVFSFENENVTKAAMPPPVTGAGLDLFNTSRSFGAWQQGSVFYMEDASKAMFNSSASKMPNDPVGAIVTLDAFNTSPEKSNFNYDVVVSNSTTFNNKAGVSAHWNAIKSYDYFKNTFNRNSINGSGGNVLSFVNIVEANGASMGNAFWNGNAMFYGNGDNFFLPLARGLDVGGHEMTHGVVEKTANLVYQNESGALNESFADIFGAMIDRDDWKIGEDVMKPGVSNGNALRSLQDPHNNENSNSPFWQPKHMNEKYNGSQDNGGVHINSGIVNHAFYLFANNAAVGKDRAEQVYYKALRDYLVKSSKFIDCRVAVIQASNDLYGAAVATAAGAAFDQVGILGSGGGGGGGGNTNYLGNLVTNPGEDFVLVSTTNYQTLKLADGAGNILGNLYNGGVASRPSVTDDGSVICFVNNAGNIMGIDLQYTSTNITPTVTQISTDPVWRNVAISKNGQFIAAITKTLEPKIYVFDLLSPLGDYREFDLYNPTYTSGQVTYDVQYADVLEFDYSGQYLMYDAYTENKNSNNEKISYWDVNFLRFWNNGFTNGVNAITKLFNGLPPKTSIGNPTFSKNSPYIIAFDVIDELNNKYNIFGANLETGENSAIAQDIGDLGVPNYSRLDNSIIYEEEYLFFGKDIQKLGVASNKISAAGNAATFIDGHVWGVWFANGKRSLTVEVDEIGNVQTSFSAFPNPVADQLTVNITTQKAMPAQLSIYNLIGQQLLSQQQDLVHGDNQLLLNTAHLPKGSFVLQLVLNNQVSTLKFVKD